MKGKLILNLSFKGNDVGYNRRHKKQCAGSEYGKYLTLSQAQSACDLYLNCTGVYDANCDNSGSFSLCPISADLYTSFTSCIYIKIGS